MNLSRDRLAGCTFLLSLASGACASAPPPAPAPVVAATCPPVSAPPLAPAAPPVPSATAAAPPPAAPVDPAAVAARDEAHARFRSAYSTATQLALAGDFERAASALVTVIPDLARHPEAPDEFWAHNAMMMIREAQGDPAAALAENDQATLAAARGTWQPEQRETLAYLKDRWHRAYLTRMLAESRKGSVRRALIDYAGSALDDYRKRARELGSNEDSIAVLEAYFAALDGQREAALEAARKVDPAKDDDLEDLYLVVVGLAAGGDTTRAEEVRRVMRAQKEVHLAGTIMLRWLEHDARPRRDGTFTPWHAGR